MDAIAVSDLSKRYTTRDGSVAALEGISFGVAEGDFVAVVGPSGCGKTTTNDLIDEINRFDPEKVAAEARVYRTGR